MNEPAQKSQAEELADRLRLPEGDTRDRFLTLTAIEGKYSSEEVRAGLVYKAYSDFIEVPVYFSGFPNTVEEAVKAALDEIYPQDLKGVPNLNKLRRQIEIYEDRIQALLEDVLQDIWIKRDIPGDVPAPEPPFPPGTGHANSLQWADELVTSARQVELGRERLPPVMTTEYLPLSVLDNLAPGGAVKDVDATSLDVPDKGVQGP